MTTPVPTDKYRRYLKGELEGAAKYQMLADVERDPTRRDVFQRLARAEMRHAIGWAQKMGVDAAGLRPAGASPSLLALRLVARVFGTGRVLPLMLRGESADIETYAADPEAVGLAREERGHGRTLRRLAGVPGEGGHVRAGGGALRAAVLGVNDGLTSNFSLVMGIAAATGNRDQVLLAGVAGLLAGAFSMAVGEYVSMRSQRDVSEHQIELEMTELQHWPEEEEEELRLLYQAKGLSHNEAAAVAKRVMADPTVALDTLAREELGLDPRELGSPYAAAASSFAAFVAGAIVPVLPYLAASGTRALVTSAALSGVALIIVGGVLGIVSGRSPVRGSLRMLIGAGAAAAVTYGVGMLIGATVLA